jgi:hypothetical protein
MYCITANKNGEIEDLFLEGVSPSIPEGAIKIDEEMGIEFSKNGFSDYTCRNGVVSRDMGKEFQKLKKEKQKKLQEEALNLEKKFIKVKVNKRVFKMNSGQSNATKLYNGILLAEMCGESTIDIVDFDNSILPDIPLKTAREIVRLVGLDYREKWKKKVLLKREIDFISEENIEELKNIDTSL